MSFRFHALDYEGFAHYFSMDAQELLRQRAVLRVVDKNPGFPCRVSLEDATIGERVLLLHFEHLTVESPFRASHAIYVREGVRRRTCEPSEVPEMFRLRQLSVRCFDKQAMLTNAYLIDGSQLEPVITKALDAPNIVHADVHFAKMGCFGARVTRA